MSIVSDRTFNDHFSIILFSNPISIHWITDPGGTGGQQIQINFYFFVSQPLAALRVCQHSQLSGIQSRLLTNVWTSGPLWASLGASGPSTGSKALTGAQHVEAWTGIFSNFHVNKLSAIQFIDMGQYVNKLSAISMSINCYFSYFS